jgi:hypothetical protein
MSQHITSPKIADCPTCHSHTTFRFVGEQEYPEVVAKAAGYATTHFSLWMCNHCNTSLLEPNLVFEVAVAE